jgi:hypothetical protein
MSGLLFRSSLVKVWIRKIEDNVLVNLPGYALIKSISAGAIGEQGTEMSPIFNEDDSWSLAFLVEQGDIFTVFIPDAPRHDARRNKIIRSIVSKN